MILSYQCVLYSSTLVRWSFPPEPLVQMIKCLEKRKHCLSPSFFRDRDPRRPRVILPFSLMGTWMRDPWWEQKGLCKWRRKGRCNREWKTVKEKEKYWKKIWMRGNVSNWRELKKKKKSIYSGFTALKGLFFLFPLQSLVLVNYFVPVYLCSRRSF